MLPSQIHQKTHTQDEGTAKLKFCEERHTLIRLAKPLGLSETNDRKSWDGNDVIVQRIAENTDIPMSDSEFAFAQADFRSTAPPDFKEWTEL